MKNKSLGLILAMGLFAPHLFAEQDHSQHHQMQMNGMYGSYPMTREASGTAWVPDSSPHGGLHVMAGPWALMFHGYATQVYDHQGGPRGDDKNSLESMFMVMAQRNLGIGTFGLRSMVSLDPAMGKNGYPLLFQTGETADGKNHLIDRQHPHDLFMELALTYSIPLGERNSLFTYFGLPGEPALGPATFMHRFSGMENPEAPITHHWLDSTHITFGVMTLGYVYDTMKLEVSGFQGREPDESRWNIESPTIDSYSYRLTWNPLPDWSGQVSYGNIHSPEQLEPEIDTERVTASIAHNHAFRKNNWQTTVAWGQNKNDHHDGDGHSVRLDALLLESAVTFNHQHTVFGRAENADKDELFTDSDPKAGSAYNVSKFSLGYIYDFATFSYGQIGIGGLGSIYNVPSGIRDAYGSSPESYMLFIRAKLGNSQMD